MCPTSTHIFMHTCIENTQQGRCNAIFLNWLLREKGADVLAHIISPTWFVNSKLVNKFTKLSVHDAIISSIYNTQDTAKLVWEGNDDSWRLTKHWSFSVVNRMTERLTVNTRKSSYSTSPQSVCVLNMSCTIYLKGLVKLEVINIQ